jgi:hypothetical protein
LPRCEHPCDHASATHGSVSTWLARPEVEIRRGIGTLSLLTTCSQAAPLVNSLALPSGGIIDYNICCDSPGTFLTTGDFITPYDAGEAPINLAGDIANSTMFSITTELTDPAAPHLTCRQTD